MPIADVVDHLRCPVCDAGLALEGRTLRCAHGHAFDLARQGYANLVTGPGRAAPGDTPAMVAARERFLGAGHYDPLTATLVECTAPAPPGLVIDLAGGPGHHLAAVVDARPGDPGLCLESSTAALRRAARAHPRAAAVGADVWRRLPLADGAASLVLSVFGPRDPDEVARVLTPGGVLVTAAAAPGHLAELVDAVGLLAVDPDKARRTAEAFARFHTRSRDTVGFTMTLDHADAAALVAMGPSAHHLAPDEIEARIATLPEPVTVTAAVEVTLRVP